MTHPPALTRRALLGAGVATAALASLPADATAAGADSFLLTNVLLETGYARDAGSVVGTLIETSAILIRDGAIAQLFAPGAALPEGIRTLDGKSMLLLPSFRDMHIHLDKTFYGGPWVPPRKLDGIAGRIALEQTLLPKMLPTLEERAGKLVTLLQTNGTTFARSQCNVDPVVGTRHVELLKHAFPQHGFVSAKLIPTMRRAMEVGATHVGGIDPTMVDGGMERSVDAMLQIAVDYKKQVDIHLHEPGASGIAAIRRIADGVEREPVLRGKVTISHGFSLMSLPEPEVAELAARMSALGMSVASTLPFGGRVMPIPTLMKHGVRVYTGTDSVMDHWSVFGTGDVLEKAKLACQLYGWNDEYGISQSLKIATGGQTPLDADGKRAWPKVGDRADMVLLPASSSAEAVARQTPRKAVFYAGKLVSGTLA
jgi:cytosine/adenosine deaminase-related metal-dependent hydrolase